MVHGSGKRACNEVKHVSLPGIEMVSGDQKDHVQIQSVKFKDKIEQDRCKKAGCMKLGTSLLCYQRVQLLPTISSFADLLFVVAVVLRFLCLYMYNMPQDVMPTPK